MKRPDSTVFRKLYDQHAGFVQFVAARSGASSAEVDDVVQETFLRLHEQLPALKDAEKIKSWLATTARRCAVDLHRKRRREVGSADIERLPAPETHESAAREADLLLVRDMVEEVAAQPDGETFRLFYVEGMSARQIAGRRGEAVSTVTTRLSRLRAKFRERFRRRLDELRAGRG